LRPYRQRAARRRLRRGGDRDRRQAPADGREAAAANADVVIVTDDNPRSEKPAAIRAAILATAPGAIEIGDRAEAIAAAIAMLRPGRCPLHRRQGPRDRADRRQRRRCRSQTTGGARESIGRGCRMTAPLWTRTPMAGAMGGRSPQGQPAGRHRHLDRQPHRAAGRGVLRHQAATASTGTTSPAGRSRPARRSPIVSEDRLSSLGKFPVGCAHRGRRRARGARAPRGGIAGAQLSARIIAVTGSVGKTGTKEALRRGAAADGEVHASVASFNNHWGVPLSARPHAGDRRATAVFEIGMNHAGEIEPLPEAGARRMSRSSPPSSRCISSSSTASRTSRDAKAEIFRGLLPDGTAVINADNPHAALLADEAAMAGIRRIVRFGEARNAEVRLDMVKLKPACSCISAEILGEKVTYKLGAPGRHLVQNSLAVLAAVSLLGADLAAATLALGQLSPSKGRGARHRLAVRGGGSATLIDESYNANPASMGAAIRLLGQAEPEGHGRRIAVLGDMRELGPTSPELHAGLAPELVAAKVDAVFLAGPHMRALHDALPAALRGGYAETAADLEASVADSVERGDVIMVKGSNASRMGVLVEHLKARLGLADDGDVRRDAS
jgi:murE/murF fusion protein